MPVVLYGASDLSVGVAHVVLEAVTRIHLASDRTRHHWYPDLEFREGA